MKKQKFIRNIIYKFLKSNILYITKYYIFEKYLEFYTFTFDFIISIINESIKINNTGSKLEQLILLFHNIYML